MRLPRNTTPSALLIGAGAIAEAAADCLAETRLGAVTRLSKITARTADQVRHARLVLCVGADVARSANALCHQARVPWISATSNGVEAVLGPTIMPGETACYHCYEMRAGGAAAALASDRANPPKKGPNIAGIAAAIAGQLLALEAARLYSKDFGRPAALGAILVFDCRLTTLTTHRVLRHPQCPICFPKRPATAFLAEA
jgi:bacteriocin biosynthesis cyclodehydratase domain-containing protein